MLGKLKVLLTSLVVCLIAVLLYSSLYPATNRITLPDPADINNIPTKLDLVDSVVDHVQGVQGGESLVLYQGDLVTGTMDGFLVGVDPESLNLKWRMKCPVSGASPWCRILGLRVVGEVLYGVDVFGRLFKFQNGEFQFLFDSKSPEVSKLGLGLFNDLVVHEDMVYITDTFTLRDDRKHLNLFQRFYSFEADGKIISYNLKTGEAKVFADKLHIPNGIELHRNNRSLLVSEGNMYRILELDLETGVNKGVFSKTGTLGSIDNIRRASKGGYWLGVSAGRTTKLHVSDLLSTIPLLRYFLTEYPTFASLLTILSKQSVEQPMFYRVDEAGLVQTVVTGEESELGTNALSEVLQVGKFVFLGSPSSRSLVRIRYLSV